MDDTGHGKTPGPKPIWEQKKPLDNALSGEFGAVHP